MDTGLLSRSQYFPNVQFATFNFKKLYEEKQLFLAKHSYVVVANCAQIETEKITKYKDRVQISTTKLSKGTTTQFSARVNLVTVIGI